jgi:hypothetical protein
MKHLQVPVPPSWRPTQPPLTEYDAGEGVRVAVSEVKALPEEPARWVRAELERRGADPGSPTIAGRVLASGWPATLGEAAAGGDALLVVLYHLLDQAAVAVVRGPAARLAARREELLDVLGRAQVSWGEPPPTLAMLLDGVVRATS